MNQTETHGLSQWEAQDRILREDFNADNAKTEQALVAQAEAQQAVEAVINAGDWCKIHTFTYEGTDDAASDGDFTLTFPVSPLLVFIHSLSTGSSLLLARGETSNGSSTYTWGEKTLTLSNRTASAQMNQLGYTYRVVTLSANE